MAARRRRAEDAAASAVRGRGRRPWQTEDALRAAARVIYARVDAAAESTIAARESSVDAATDAAAESRVDAAAESREGAAAAESRVDPGGAATAAATGWTDRRHRTPQATTTAPPGNYAAEIENLDRLFGTVLDAATKRDPNIIACAFSDHGEMLDDHDDQDKSKPWQGAVAVPLICAGPGISRNRTVAAPAAIYDLGATALDWAGATQPPNTTACSMRGLLEGEDESKRNRTIVLSGLRETSWNEPDPRFDFRLAVGAFGNTT